MRQAAAEGSKVRLSHPLPIRYVRYSLSGSFDAGPDSQLHFVINNNETVNVLKVLSNAMDMAEGSIIR